MRRWLFVLWRANGGPFVSLKKILLFGSGLDRMRRMTHHATLYSAHDWRRSSKNF
jgi:hypothetical protein